MDMSMQGFRMYSEYGDGDVGCIAYLWPKWVIDTPYKFWCAVAGTFVLSVMAEACVALRRAAVAGGGQLGGFSALASAQGSGAARIDSNASRMLWTLVEGMLYLVQVVLGYTLMLVAMTYQLELFLAVAVGLAVGHMVFNRPSVRRNQSGTLREGATAALACCAVREDDDLMVPVGSGEANPLIGDQSTELLVQPSASNGPF